MKRLFILRHAKAVSAGPQMSDRTRGLTDRGQSDAAAMGRHMGASLYRPDLVYCSPAARTMETWALVAPGLDAEPKVEFYDAMYLAAWTALFALVRAAPDAAENLLMIGHNPAFENLALALARRHGGDRDEAGRRTAVAGKFPTCALAVVTFAKARWETVAAGEGTLTDFIRPKDLNRN
jgi:phosphohistidine phosphatase